MQSGREWHLDLRYPDLYALGGLLRVCSMAITPLAPAPLKAVLGSDVVDDTILCSSRYEFPVRARFRLPEDRSLIAFVHEAGEGSWVGGEKLEPGMVLLGMPGSRCELRFGAGSSWSLMLPSGNHLRREFARLDYYAQTVSRRVQRLVPKPGSEAADRLRSAFECMRLRFVQRRLDINMKALLERLQAHIMQDIVSLFPATADTSRTRHSHYLVLRRVENFIAANMRHEIRARDLCEAGSTSERNLRYIFGEFMGISPNHYLSTLRLCEARRLLSESTPGQNTVRAIALECGLWDLSRFAENYRQLFDELPSETLRIQKTSLPEKRTPYLSPSIQYT
jgi:AraC family transcriptional regulator, ethanolamine operon transcriptional activator